MVKWFVGLLAVGLALLVVVTSVTEDLWPWLIQTFRALEHTVQAFRAEHRLAPLPEDRTAGMSAAYPTDVPDPPAPFLTFKEAHTPYQRLRDEGIVAPGFGAEAQPLQQPKPPPVPSPAPAPPSPPPRTREQILQLYHTMKRNVFTAIDTLEEQDRGH
jgi:hypothetical protein